MGNILNYLHNNANISFKQLPFNVVDSLILSTLSYLPFTKYTSSKNFTGEIILDKIKKDQSLSKEKKQLFEQAFNGIRYNHLHIYNPVSQNEKETEKQFATNTFVFNDNSIYVAFRGTDSTLVGWKEDLNMGFMDVIPSQIDAVNYLRQIINHFSNYKIFVGGHSKGGNLAVYSAIFINEALQNKIHTIFSHDGPGFRERIFKEENYLKIVDKINKTIPESSLFGLLLENQEKLKIIKSSQFWIFQHDPFSWLVENNDFIYLNETSKLSKSFDSSLNQWLTTLSDSERQKFINTLYEVCKQLDIEKINQLKFSLIIHKLPEILLTIKNIDPKTKKFIYKTIKALIKITYQNFMKNS